MSVNLKFLNSGKVLYAKFKGIVTLKDFKTSSVLVYSKEQVHLQRYRIIDFSDCSSLELSNSDIRIIVSMNKGASKLNSNIKIGIIATNDLTFALSRVYQVYEDTIGYEIIIFRDKDSCDKWLEKQLVESSK